MVLWLRKREVNMKVYYLIYNSKKEYQVNVEAAKRRKKELENKGLQVAIGFETYERNNYVRQ